MVSYLNQVRRRQTPQRRAIGRNGMDLQEPFSARNFGTRSILPLAIFSCVRVDYRKRAVEMNVARRQLIIAQPQ